MEAPTPSRWLGEAVFTADPIHCPANTVEVLAKGRGIRSKEVRRLFCVTPSDFAPAVRELRPGWAHV